MPGTKKMWLETSQLQDQPNCVREEMDDIFLLGRIEQQGLESKCKPTKRLDISACGLIGSFGFVVWTWEPQNAISELS